MPKGVRRQTSITSGFRSSCLHRSELKRRAMRSWTAVWEVDDYPGSTEADTRSLRPETSGMGASRRLSPDVSMMKPTNSWHRNQMRTPVWLCDSRPHRGSVPSKTIVRTIFVVIGDVILDQTAQVTLVEDNHVIQHFSATTPDPSFRNSVLPWTTKARSRRFQTAGRQEIPHLRAEFCISI